MATLSLPVASKPEAVLLELERIVVELGWKRIAPKPGFHLQANRGMNFWSWGDRIQAQVYPTGTGSLVVLQSRPRMQLYNWGQDEKNVQAVVVRLLPRLTSAARR
ncbi:MAG: hypothetical protein WC876_07095 [Candidatus Thermoplasmatota archaeon]|jgi:hypothetical protein